MKRSKFTLVAALSLCVVGIVIGLHGYAFAQPTAAADAATSTLDNAINLLNENKPQAARELIATIATTDPDYPEAQCYKALCLYELTNYPAFLKLMESPAISNAVISSELREDLGFKRINALFTYRRFEEVLPQIESFQKNYSQSPQLPAVFEYRIATFFERGMKNAMETSHLTNQDQITQRWTQAQTNLQEFLSLASSSRNTNYTFLRKRVLKEDEWLARMTLADDQAAFAEIPAEDTTAQEKFSFLRIQLYAEKLYRAHVDQNLKLAADYLEKFPPSDHRKRVEFDMCEFSFKKGEQLSVEAAAAERARDTKTAGEKRAAASHYFEQMRSFQSQIVTNSAAGIEESDVLDSRDDLLYSYYLEKNYERVLSLTTSMIAESKPGDMNWIIAKLYTGITLTRRSVSKTTSAATVLDEVLALGFKNKPDQDHYVLFAAKWRIFLAQRAGETKKAVELVQWVQDGNCAKKPKAEFLKDYGYLIGLPKN